MPKTVEFPIRISSTGHFFKLRKVYDNGGVSADRFTASFDIYDPHTGKWFAFTESINCGNIEAGASQGGIYCMCMSSNPFHPQGVGLSGTCVEGRHLGKRVKFSELPNDVQKCIIRYLES